MTVKGGTTQACAACKYQRRKCSDKCILAPYFPAANTKSFQSAHRLFGVSNMMKILKQVTAEQRHDAMQSIIYESDIRERFPVHGCLGIIEQLTQQYQQALHELSLLNKALAMYRNNLLPSETWQPPSSSSSHLAHHPSSSSSYHSPALDQSRLHLQSIPVHIPPISSSTQPQPQPRYNSLGNVNRSMEMQVPQAIPVQAYNDAPIEITDYGQREAIDSSSSEESKEFNGGTAPNISKSEFKSAVSGFTYRPHS